MENQSGPALVSRGTVLRNVHESDLLVLYIDEEKVVLWANQRLEIPRSYLVLGGYRFVRIADEEEVAEAESQLQSYLD